MIVGVLKVRLRIHDNHSLKGKRKVIKSIMGQVAARFNCAVSEVADHDLWQTGVIGIATVGNDGPTVNSALDKIVSFIDRNIDANLTDTTYEIIHFGE